MAGKTALVAGAASGIGRATALLLAQEGAAVCCADIDAQGAGATARAIEEAGDRSSSCRLDVSSEESWRAALDQVTGTFGRLDVLVSSAGISFARPVTEMSLDEWRRVMAVNLEGVFLGTKHAILALRRTGGGSIVHISSASGLKSAPGASAYSASKAAVCMFVKAAARECLQNGDRIRINTVCPGGVKTPLWRDMPFFHDLVKRPARKKRLSRSWRSPARRAASLSRKRSPRPFCTWPPMSPCMSRGRIWWSTEDIQPDGRCACQG